MHLPSPQGVQLIAVCAVLAVVAAYDVGVRKVPNACVALLLGGGLLNAALGGWDALGASVIGAAVGGLVLALPYSRGWMGAGDVKLMAGIGAWVGGGGALLVLLFGSALAGALAVVALLRLGRPERAKVGHNLMNAALLRGLAVPEPSRLSVARGVPYGVPLALVAAALLVARSVS